ncbi:MAG: helix-turn-helix domain-containing protein, partial [Gammaproteobacteria bacterium]
MKERQKAPVEVERYPAESRRNVPSRISTHSCLFLAGGDVQSVERIMRILEGLTHEEEGVTVSELARRIRLPIPTTFRILLALTEHALVEHNRQTKRYRLGVALARLSYHALNNHD